MVDNHVSNLKNTTIKLYMRDQLCILSVMNQTKMYYKALQIYERLVPLFKLKEKRTL